MIYFMKYIIRKATINDLDSIVNLNHKLCQKEFKEYDPTINPDYSITDKGKEDFKKDLTKENSIGFVVEDDNKIIGYVIGYFYKGESYRNVDQIGEIGNMWIDDEYRSQGIGKEFIENLEKWFKEKNVKRIKVVATFQNQKAIDFYKREGFKEYEVIFEKDV